MGKKGGKKKLASTQPNKPLRSPDGRLLPGYTANPNGRPTRRDLLAEALDAILLEPSGRDVKKSKLEAIVRKAVRLAETGNLRAIEYLWDRREGRPKQTIQVYNEQAAGWLEWLNKHVDTGIESEANENLAGLSTGTAETPSPGGGGAVGENGTEQSTVLSPGESPGG